ncbi:MAG: T9SS type A sorting domain-containing protein [Bacteroidales bacterium]|nr:T9SS type A sorting domain-containing protein [Bacteroidales bacterium]
MIFGPEGFGDDLMVSARTKIPYTIEFENDPEFATAPASRVEIEYPIPAEQRLASFRLGDFGFGQFVFTVPSNTSSYYQRLDVSDSLGVWVDITAGIDIIHNKAFWVFQSIDPSTGSEPQSSQLGFLLVNDDEGRGEGYVNYYISPADGLQTGDTTSAVATIVFDDNAPISTNVWTNMFDAIAPSSSITNVDIIENDSTNCVISFASQDDLNGSGVHSIELFVSVNGEPYLSAGSYAPESEVNYQLMNGSYYEFISIATDNVGNVEDFKTIPDATVDYGFAPSDITLSKYYFYENNLVGSAVGELNTIDVGDVFTYQLVDGEGASDNSLFAISGNRLVTNADFNCEERLDYSVRVRSTDVSNLYVEKAFDISKVKTNQTYDLNYEGDICQGENFFGYGWNINLLDSISGTYTYTRDLQTVSGCDSIRTLTVRVHPVYSMQITDEIEYGEDYTSNGFNIENPFIGIVHDTLYLQTAHGCDSIVSLTLTVNPDESSYIFITAGNWSEPSNWLGGALPGVNDNAFINADCTLDIDAAVVSLTVLDNQSLTIPESRILTVSGTLTNADASGLVIEDGGQLMHTNAGAQGTVQKTILPYTNNNDGWYLVASPIVGNIAITSVANILSNNYDLYYYDEPTHYWINQEYAANDFTELTNGKGYLYANSEEVMLGFEGELQSGSAVINVLLSYTDGIDLAGFNLVGNPYAHNVTSYSSVNVANGCYQINETKDDLVVSEIDEDNPLKPAEGFFVKATDVGASITFNPGRGETTNRSGSIRVELLDNGKLIDRLIVKREGEPLEKMSLNESRTKVFAMQDHREMAIVPCEGNEQPVNFKAAKNGTYTINVNTNGIEFNYLHLIDNFTGADVDLLALRQAQGSMSYTFEAKTSDYASRFRLVFSVCGDADGDSETFAFFSNGNWIIINNGEATLQVIDIHGRILSSETISGSCSKAIHAAPGVYMIRLINGENVKTQKIIVE